MVRSRNFDALLAGLRHRRPSANRKNAAIDRLDFSSKTPAVKAENLQRLLSETQIATASDIFVGGFKSNVARFIVLRHSQSSTLFQRGRAERHGIQLWNATCWVTTLRQNLPFGAIGPSRGESSLSRVWSHHELLHHQSRSFDRSILLHLPMPGRVEPRLSQGCPRSMAIA